VNEKKPRALYYHNLNYVPENLDLLARSFCVTELPDPSHDTNEILERVDLCFAPLGHYFDAAKMDRCPSLRVIASNTTGDSHIDVEAASARGIHVITLKDDQEFLSTITPTAEHAWGLMLAVMRNTLRGHAAVLEGQWSRYGLGGRQMLSRMSLGIVGIGRLGSLMARYGRAFGMTVFYYDPYRGSDIDGIERLDGLEELVKVSDVVSLHAPSNRETRGLLGRDILFRFKPGAYLINTARGELVDEAALVDALEEGRIAGVGVDVLDGEFDPAFIPADNPLVRYAQTHSNIVLTPHVGGSTIDAWRETQQRVIERSADLFRGEERL